MKLNNKIFKKNKGITLVALVITIVILLILAGISIAQLTGNGLFENAKLAKEKSENAIEEENEKLSQYGDIINEYIDGTRTNANSGGTLLWENPNYTEAFLPQTIILNDSLSNYKYIKILFRASCVNNSVEVVNNTSYSIDTLIIDNKVSSQMYLSYYESVWTGHPLYYRYFNGEEKEITFENAYTSGSGSNNANNNNACIPYYILGYNF